MQRFYLSPLALKNKELTVVDQRVLHQVNKVLRMKPNEFFQAFNENEGEYLFQIQSLDRKSLTAKQVKKIENHSEPKLQVSLYQSIPKKPATLELIVQKATEIGVSAIYPLITKRTQTHRLPKMDRLQLIAMEAAEQCGRLQIPTLHHPVDFEKVLPTLSCPFMAYEFEQDHYLEDYVQTLYQTSALQLIIGPEGGFNEQEVNFAKKHSIPSFSLGPRILRMETAAITALGLILLRRA